MGGTLKPASFKKRGGASHKDQAHNTPPIQKITLQTLSHYRLKHLQTIDTHMYSNFFFSQIYLFLSSASLRCCV